MDCAWADEDWKPTAGVFEFLGQWDKPTKGRFKKLKAQLQQDARNLRDHTCDPKLWFTRGKTLLSLGYPELAAGDFERTLILIDHGLDYSSKYGKSVRLPWLQNWIRIYRGPAWELKTFTSAEAAHNSLVDPLKKFRKDTYIAYVDALYLNRAIPDVIQLCKDALKLYPRDRDFLELLEEGEDTFSTHMADQKENLIIAGIPPEKYAWGMLAIRLYPWTPSDLRTRTAATIASANQMLLSCSDSLEIRSSSVGGLGMFAKRDIQKGERILSAPSVTGTSNKPSTGRYCYNCAAALKTSSTLAFSCCPSMKFCGEECKTIAGNNYHNALCGKDFSDIYKSALSNEFAESTVARDTLIFLRLLAMSVQARTHPLATPPIAWITANYEAQSPLPWSRGVNIIGPIKILEKLGVNIFAEEYDTWVMQTMLNRARNNSRTHDSSLRQTVINPMYSFFNHSCEPDTLDQTELSRNAEQTSRAVMICTKAVKAGTEVFTSYMEPNVLMLPKAMRHHFMTKGSWFGPEVCRCKRCLAETR
ncbi:hypothetical protein L207DRAFT_571522 [Hyaloscypha variabilis F]|uniref:SET domain-containing protein n=1 Tax=Hyaloscypha variabilis (strain UAMH 11265 / GT02V1 / F) TaxID=1149755 RepID=A0A2J6R497_HYAVF|nr:hypothetical protein L207DRAFT_571522 [Hyaloscypha variabilis F]